MGKASLKTHKYNHSKKNMMMKNESSESSEELQNQAGVGLDKTIGDDMDLESKIDTLTEKRDGVWTCLQCGKYDNSRFHLRRHVETHIQGFSHSCPVCEKSFSTRGGLKSHIVTKHPEEKPTKPYNCDICDKSSSSKMALKVHKIRNHDNQSDNENIKADMDIIEPVE